MVVLVSDKIGKITSEPYKHCTYKLIDRYKHWNQHYD